MGDEYTAIGEYADKDTPVTTRHNTCGLTKDYLPHRFLDGVRCSHCSRTITDGMLKDTVETLSDGKYHVVGRQGKNKYLISDGSGLSVELTKQKTLQELTRATPSPILPLDFPCKPLIMPKNSTDRLTDCIKAQYDLRSIIFLEDLSVEGCSYTRTKADCGALVKSGILKSAAPGVYAFPGHGSTLDELMGVRHPGNESTHMTTDFLVTYKGNRLHACSVKFRKSDLDDKRTLEKLYIEKRYWEQRRVPWKLVFKEDLPEQRITNIRTVVEYYDAKSVHDPISQKSIRSL